MQRTEQTPLAIIGMACRVPGADDLDQFWELLVGGKCAIGEVGTDRLNRDLHYDARRGVRSKTYMSIGGTIQYPAFDAFHCPIPARRLASAEVGHQMICQVAASACRHAGLNPFDLPERNVGVYVGHNLGGPVAGELIYATRVAETAKYLLEVEPFLEAVGGDAESIVGQVVDRVRRGLPRRGAGGIPRSSVNIGASIISEALGLNGPSLVLDAACSSALQGLAMASRALRLNNIDMAIVGGASYFSTGSLMLFSKAQSGSAQGCRPFDDAADGLVSGEGYAAILVKTLDRALADGDPIHAVIRGIGVSSDGRGKSLWAPRQEGQVLAMQRAYRGGIDLRRLQFVEAHATSTRLGDLTELKALAELLDGQLSSGHKIPIGGVKANVGHTLESAGLLGLIKAVLAMQNKTVPQQINISKLNTGVDWAQAPFYVPTSNVAWPEFEDGHPRRAAVNSFGIGGLNVHVVVDERILAGDVPQDVSVAAPVISPPSARQPVAIVGAGCIFPGARTLDAFCQQLFSGHDPKTDAPADRWDVKLGHNPDGPQPYHSVVKRGGFITDFEFDWRRHKIPPLHVAHADPLQLMVLDATDAALTDAGYELRSFDTKRVGVVVGTIFGSEFSEQLKMGFNLPDFCASLAEELKARGVPDSSIESISEAYGDALLKHMPALLDETGGFTPSTLASRITKTYDLMGGAATIDSGQASSLAAISLAVDQLRNGDCDMVICAAGHRSMGLPIFEMLSMSSNLRGDDPKSPFDAEASGYLLGEGVGVLILKRLADAERDSDTIRGVIDEIGVGFSESATASVGQAVDRAYQTNDDSLDDIALLETSGTGSTSADVEELLAIEQRLSADAAPRPLSTVVGQIGHTQGAAGMASLLKAMYALEQGRTPGTVGLSTPNADIQNAAPHLRVAVEESALGLPGQRDGRLTVGVNNVDPAGAAYHLVLRRPPRKATESGEAAKGWRIIRIGADSEAELVARVGASLDNATDLFAAAEDCAFDPRQCCRLAVVAESVDDLKAKLKRAAEQIGTPKAALLDRQQIFVGHVAESPGRIAFVFPGQGSQYPGMFEPLVGAFPAAAEALSEIDEILQQLGFPPFAEVAWGGGERLGEDVWLTQLSIMCADLIAYRSLQSIGIHPDLVAGHSFGEFPALAAAGVWDARNAILGTRARCDAIEACRNVRGQMVSVAAAGPQVEQICRELGGQTYPANYNSPDQTVVGGDAEGIAQLVERLKSNKIACKALAVPRPFHTPLMEAVKAPLKEGLASVTFRPPSIALLSSVNNRLVESTDQARSNLIAQMTSPVHYVQLVEQLANFGVRGVVEVGPRDVLSRLNAKILRDQNIGIIACDQKNLDPVAGVLGVHARLDSLGLLDYPSSAPSVDVFAVPSELPGQSPAPEDISYSPNQLRVDVAPAHIAQELVDSPLIELAADPFEAGRERGAAASDAIRRIARRFADMSGGSYGDPEMAALISQAEGLADRLDEPDREELRGMAAGADVPLSALLVYNAWLDRSCHCSAAHVAFHAPHSGSTIHCFDESMAGMAPWAEIANHWEVNCQRLREGRLHAFVTRPGALGALAGMNHHGLAISSVATKPGAVAMDDVLPWRAVIVRAVLRDIKSLDDAVEMLRHQKGREGWQFCLSHALDRRLCRIDFDVNDARVHTDVSTVVSVAETPSLVSTASPSRMSGVPMASTAGSQSALTRQEFQRFVDLESQWSPDKGPSASQFAQLKTLSHSSLRLVMEPALGELVVQHDDLLMHRYRIEHETVEDQAIAAERGPDVAAIPVEQYLAGSQSVDGIPPFDIRGQVCHRFILRTLRTPIAPAVEGRQLVGAAVVIGQNEVAQALRGKLTDLGTTVVSLPLLDSIDKMSSAMEKIWENYRPLNFFITTPFDEDAGGDMSPEGFERRVRRELLLPYLACQKWFSLVSDNNLVGKAKAGAVTRMGGDLGLSGRMKAPVSGAFCALMKALGIEVGYASNWSFVAKAVDAAPGESPEFVAEALVRELQAVSWFAEFGYTNEKRYVMGAYHQFPQPVSGSEPTAGRPWLITGGARGITAAVARELGHRFGVKLHLIGTSPLPEIDAEWRAMTPAERQGLRTKLTKQALAEKRVPNELWNRVEKAIEIDTTLREIRDLGVEVSYHSCDCSDRDGMRKLLDEIRRNDGPLEGIIHGAGFENASRFAKKSVETFQKTLSSKAIGAAVLMDLTRNDPLRYFFGFGSISGRWGSIGQTDYCMASDLLCKMVNRYRVERPEVRSCCFHWQPWAEVGMAARDETRGANVLEEVKLLPPAEGVEHFMNELLAGAPENEVLITDWAYYKRYHPDLSPEEVTQIYSPTEPSAPLPPTAVERPTEAVRPHATDANPTPRKPDVTPAEQVSMRHVMRMVEYPRDRATPSGFQFHGPAWILGDNQDATALAQRLQQMGVETWSIPTCDSDDALMLVLEQRARQRIAPHLFVMTGRDSQASHVFSQDEWLSRRQNGVVLPFRVARKWCDLVADAASSPPISLVIATSLGGDFGFAEPVVAPEGGAMTGLVKGLLMEFGANSPDKTILKVIDAPAEMPSHQLANEIVEELKVKDLGVEVAVSALGRFVPRLKRLDVDALPRNDISPGGTWLVTGGARGITAVAARELARRFKLKLHLFGTSLPPQVDPTWLDYDDEQKRQLRMRLVRQAREEGNAPGTYWDRARKDLEIAGNLRDFAEEGVQATYRCCDVTDWNQLEETLREIRKTSGPIEGIVHGAGIHGPALSIAQTTPEILTDLLAVKVDAAVALMSLTRQDPIRFFVGFGSITGRFGSFNASAYSMASDMLCKLVGWYRGQRPDCTAFGVHWHPWGEVGMMTRPVAQHTIKVFKMNLMSPTEGAGHLIEELRAGGPESEVLVTDAQFYEAFYSKELVIDDSCSAEVSSPAGALVEEVVELTPGARCITKANLDPVRDPFLRDHRLRDKPTLPLVVALEAFAEAALLLGGERRVAGIRDVQISDAVRFFNDSPKDVRVLAEVTAHGVRCRMTSDFYNLRGQLVQANRPHFCGYVDFVDVPHTLEATLPEVRGKWFDMTYPDRGSMLYHGPPLRLLQRMAVDEQGTFGQIRLPSVDELPGERDASQWGTPSAAIDACLYACGVYTWFRENQAFAVPHSLQSILFGRPPRPEEETIVHVVCTDFGDGFGVFDFTLFGEDDSVILQASGYRCHVIQGGGE